MGFVFQIRPVSLEKGFTLSCDGILERERSYRRLVDALVDAIQLGSALEGEVCIFDVEGRIADVLPLPRRANECPETVELTIASNAARSDCLPYRAEMR